MKESAAALQYSNEDNVSPLSSVPHYNQYKNVQTNPTTQASGSNNNNNNFGNNGRHQQFSKRRVGLEKTTSSNGDLPLHKDQNKPKLKKWSTSNDIRRWPQNEAFQQQSAFNYLNHSNQQSSSTLGHLPNFTTKAYSSRHPSNTSDHNSDGIKTSHNSMNSLIPMAVYEEGLPGIRLETTSDYGSVDLKTFNISEEVEDDEEDHDTSDESDDEIHHYQGDIDVNSLWVPQVDNSSKPVTPSPEEIHEGMEEIHNFQNNFVQHSLKTPDIPTSRVQQKMFEARELGEIFENLRTSETGSNWALPMDYNTKLQSESLNSQYTLLRLRFNTSNDIGVLGFLKRKQHFGNYRIEQQVRADGKDQYLRELWSSELEMFETVSPVESKSDPLQMYPGMPSINEIEASM